MQSIKLHEATKQFKISNKLAMFFLEKNDVPVKSHSSTISMDQLELLREFSSNKEKFLKIVEEFNRLEKEKKKEKVQEAEPAQKPAPEVLQEEVVLEEPVTESVAEPVVDPPEPHPEPEPVKEPEVKQELPKPPVVESKPVKKLEKPAKPEPKKVIIVKEEPAKPVQKVTEARRPSPPARRHQQLRRVRHPQPAGSEVSKQRQVIPKKPVVTKSASQRIEEMDLPEMIQVSNYITLKELADALKIKLKFLDEYLKQQKKEYPPNQFLEASDIKEICQQFSIEFDIVPYEDFIFYKYIEKHNAHQDTKSPVVTVMGHVDHGKTTLLDTLRNSRIADREKGGITQKIGAYQLKAKGHNVIFIDTPGHEAFTNIRARGAQVTDIVILIVAAEEGVKPQTIEAINHALSAEVPIIVAINKIDKDGADANKVKQELTKHNILVEDWGGDVVCVEISAKHNKNLDALLDMIALVSEMQELKTFQGVPARGVILESRLDPKLGPVATVLIQAGELKRGDFFICGNSMGKVKAVFDDWGKTLNEAKAVLPVEIMGFEEVPEAGERFQVIDDTEKARKVIELRKHQEKEAKTDEILAGKKLNLQNLIERFEESKTKVLQIIVKTDNYSSGEVLEKILLKQNQEKLKINIVHNGVGHVTESDYLLAATANALLVGFNVKVSQKILTAAKRQGIDIRLYSVIYHLIEEIERIIKGEVEPEYVEAAIGKVEVLQKFKISRIGTIAGCLVKEGKITNKSKIRVMRGEDMVFEGELQTLKRIKDEVTEVKAGTECGIRIRNFNNIEVGDMLEAF